MSTEDLPSATQTPHRAHPAREPEEELPVTLRWVREQTPARILEGRTGGSYRTSTWLQLRADHASARDAVLAELDLERDLGREIVERYGLFEVATRARSKHAYLAYPEHGRQLDTPSRDFLVQRCPVNSDIQIAIGDGLSAAAVAAQAPSLLPRLASEAAARGWRFGQPFVIRHCRVGVLNVLGELLDPAVVVLLIGERPGLATAESLSAYLAYRPRPGDDDSRRNLVSNIHARGVSTDEAASRIIRLAELMRQHQSSGVGLKEDGPPALDARTSRIEGVDPR